MDINDQLPELSSDNQIESKREIIRGCLNEVIVEIGDRLREAGLNAPIFLTVPRSGDAIVTMATPLDPSDNEWSQVTKIVCSTVSERLNGLKLRGREMICAMANSTMVAADLITD
jgi:hypothetical protein